MEAGGSVVQDSPQLHSEFKASLGQMVRMIMEEEEEKTRKLKSYLDMVVAYA